MTEMTICQPTVEDREQLFTNLYLESFPLVARYVSKMGGSLEEAQDVFQDALVVFYERIILGNTELQKDEKAYLLGVARLMWIRKYQEKQKTELTDTIPEGVEEAVPGPSADRVLRFLERAGRKCMELLKSFYYDRQSMPEVADKFGYTTVRSATVQKYKCLEKVRDEVKQKSMSYEDFLE